MAQRFIVCAVRDRQSEVFTIPQYYPTRGAAIRSFSDAVNSKQGDNMLTQHPEDFDLFMLATFDDDSGFFTALERPEQLAVGKNMVVKDK